MARFKKTKQKAFKADTELLAHTDRGAVVLWQGSEDLTVHELPAAVIVQVRDGALSPPEIAMELRKLASAVEAQ